MLNLAHGGNISYFGDFICRRKEKTIHTLEEDCEALSREIQKGKDVVASLLLVVRQHHWYNYK